MKLNNQVLIPSFDGELLSVEVVSNHPQPKTDIVLLHGMGGDSQAVVACTQEILANIPRTRCVTYDLRGHGFSSHKFPANTHSIEACGAADLEAICRYLKLKLPVLVGHSFGGLVVQEYLAERLQPSPLFSLLLCSPLKTLPLSISRHFWFRLLQRLSENFKTSQTRRTLSDHLKFRESHDVSASRLYSDMRYSGPTNFLLMYLSMFGWKLNSVKQLWQHNRIFFLAGKKDFFMKRPDVPSDLVDSRHHNIFSESNQDIVQVIKNNLTNQSPFFSIIIPCLNEEKYLPRLLEDLTEQSMTNFEVLVVDGQSEDQTVNKAKVFGDKLKLKIITASQRNVCHQRNLGAKNAKGHWLIFVDADAQVNKTFLSSVKTITDSKAVDLFTTKQMPDENRLSYRLITALAYIGMKVSFYTPRPFLVESVVMIKNTTFNKLGGFNHQLSTGEGSYLVRQAKKNHFITRVFSKPPYIVSMRRFSKQGTTRTLIFLFITWLHDIFNLNTKSSIYPMNGGSYYETK